MAGSRDYKPTTQRMAKYLLLLCIVCLQVGSSDEIGSKVKQCRQIFKAKPPVNAPPTWTDVFTFNEGESCTRSVTLHMTDADAVNVTDPRNCQNFYQCQGLTCQQCPCPGNETFNPKTLRCDSTNAVCECEATEQSTTVIAEISITQISPEQSTKTEKFVPPAQGSAGTQDTPENSTNGVVIIVVIVVLTVVILLALIVGFCLWQRGVFPLKKEANMHPSNNDGYLHTLPPQERHVYAEIDERTVSQNMDTREQADEMARRHQHHIYTPPISTGCVHPHETFVLPPSHSRSYPQFSGCPPQGHASITHNNDLIGFSSASPESKGNFSQNNNKTVNGCCPECMTDNSSVGSCSGCSNCSGMSGHTHLEGQEAVDRRTLLNYSQAIPHNTQLHFVSRQVYI